MAWIIYRFQQGSVFSRCAALIPELSSADEADDLLQSLAAQLEQDPERAVAAQGGLDEDQVRSLLDED